MNTIKVQCGCGQRYAFDIEPVEGRMPYTVACPICGVDGTSAANELLAQNFPITMTREALPPPPPPSPQIQRAPTARVHVPIPAAAPARETSSPARLLPGQIARPQAQQEARAKIFWGDPPEEVVKFLMRQGIPYAEASEIANGFFDERAAALRSDGIGKIVTGIGMACVPVAAWAFFTHIGVLPIKIFALTVMVGCYGAYRLLKGTIQVVSPRSEIGDVAAQ